MTEVTIATRGSALALAQARGVASLLTAAHPDLVVSLVEVTTSGDRDRTTSVAALTEVGAFVRAVQQSVIDGTADIAVHSCKDLPVDDIPGVVPFYPAREAPWDALCGSDLDSLPAGARVGTGSPRRAAQLAAIRPDVVVADIRGNVGTRLDRVASGELDAVVLAEAGLRRLGRVGEMRHRFTVDEMVPAPAQGALAVEVRDNDPLLELVAVIDHPSSRLAVETERSLLANTGAGCRSALGALATLNGGDIDVTGFVEDGEGRRRARARGRSPEEAARSLQRELGL